MVKKKNQSQGRQKIAMEKIANKSNLQVTFSKRRSGLFKKASEICTLCGVQVAIVVFSPAGKVFSFGHPQVESTVDRFLIGDDPLKNSNSNSNTNKLIEAHRDANICELNAQLSQLHDMLEMERRKGEEIAGIREAGRREWWWQAPIDELGLQELQQLRIALEELKGNVKQQARQVLVESTYNCQFLGANVLF